MTIDEFFEHYYFHDAGVDKITFNPEIKMLQLDIDFGHYIQEGYQEGDPETSPATLVFTNVENFQPDPELSVVDFSINTSGEILTCGHIAAKDAMGLEAAEIVINWMNYQDRTHNILILTFLASSAVLTLTSA